MHYTTIIKYVFELLAIYSALCEGKDYIRIPVSISPLVQASVMEMSGPARYIYQNEIEFYSNVTVTEVAKNCNMDIKGTIEKSVRVVFLLAASSRISGTFQMLSYPKQSKWSYQVPLEELLEESDESVKKLTDSIKIYKIQDLAMKALGKKYGFNENFILQKHRISLMDFYAADEEQWIKIVRTIVELVIKKRSDELNLMPCYLAEMIEKSQEEMEEFTLDDLDRYLSNTSVLFGKLPHYRYNKLARFYEALQVTPLQISAMSNVSISQMNLMGVKDSVQHSIKTILLRLNLVQAPLHIPENETLCPRQWMLFRDMILKEAFVKQAKEMSILPETLGEVIKVPYATIEGMPLPKMIHLTQTVINPVKEGKLKIETFTLSMLRDIRNSRKLNVNKHNAISLIKRATSLGKRKLKLLYGWKTSDYHFARIFSVKDLGDECSFDVNNKTLVSLAKINIGHLSDDVYCTKFFMLKMVWGQASLNDLSEMYFPMKKIPLDEPLAAVVSKLTNSSIRISCRVLSRTAAMQWLLTKLTLNNVSDLTNYTTIYLQEIPIRRIVFLIHELLTDESLDMLMQVFKTNNNSTGTSTMNFDHDEIFTEAVTGHGKPTAQPRSLAKRYRTDIALLMMSLLITSWLKSWISFS